MGYPSAKWIRLQVLFVIFCWPIGVLASDCAVSRRTIAFLDDHHTDQLRKFNTESILTAQQNRQMFSLAMKLKEKGKAVFLNQGDVVHVVETDLNGWAKVEVRGASPVWLPKAMLGCKEP